jgi:hypothetical protein
VDHDCNPCYSGGRDQGDCGLIPVQAKSSRDPILKKILHTHTQERTDGVTQGVGPEFKPQYHKNTVLIFALIRFY